jgi:hypothetical protein
MRWIQGVSLQGTSAGFSVYGGQAVPPDELSKHLLATPWRSRRKFSSCFQSWTTEPDDRLVRGVGLPTAACGAQAVFRLQDGGIEVLVPATAVAAALFAPLSEFSPYLLRPQALDLLAVPGNVEDWRPQFLPGRLTRAVFASDFPRRRLSWLLHYPSARASFESVLLHAMQGAVTLDLPRGTGHFVAAGRLVGKTLYAHRLAMLALDTDEAPFPGTVAPSQRLVFNEHFLTRPAHRRGAPPAADERLTGFGDQPLSDEAWGRIAQLMVMRALPSSRARVHDYRQLLEVVLKKLATKTPWGQLPYSRPVVQSATVLYSKLRRQGAWDDVLAALR